MNRWVSVGGPGILGEAIEVRDVNGPPGPSHAGRVAVRPVARLLRDERQAGGHVPVIRTELHFDSGPYRRRRGEFRWLDRGGEEQLGQGAEFQLSEGCGHHVVTPFM